MDNIREKAEQPNGLREGSIFEDQVSAKAFELLSKSIPGGIMGGYLEEGFPLYYINNHMLNELGYTYQEFVDATEGLVINSMHPEDRMRVDDAVDKAFQAGQEYEVRYRMLTKNGRYIWVKDVGKQSVDQNGRPVCISVVRNITNEVEAEERLKKENEEKEKQACRYDRLFHSVLCGIVQYQYQDGERVVFRNANQEAIRIFGYDEESFWKIKSWKFQDVVAAEDWEYLKKYESNIFSFNTKTNYECRVLRRDGGSNWIIGNSELLTDIDGNQIIQSVFMDINAIKEASIQNQLLSRQVEAGYQLLRTALAHTGTCEFGYDVRKRIAYIPERTRSKYGWRAAYECMPGSFSQEAVAAEYQQNFCRMFSRIHMEEATAGCTFQAINGEERFWCRVTLSSVEWDERNDPVYAIGVVEDITKEKQMEAELNEARSRDSLTGLYSKEAGILKVKEYMEQKGAGEECTIMLLDMDDFYKINQEESSIFADTILQDVAQILVTESGEDGLPVRLGGDEFMLLVKNCGKSKAGIVGPRIASRIQELSRDCGHEVKVSASIGMCASQVVDEYSGLYRCAESTLRYVKEHTKGMAACYLDTSNELGTMLTKLYTEEHLFNEIEQPGYHKEEDLITFALELLGKTKRLDDAIFLLLARIGKHKGLDRVSIISADLDYRSFRYIYQWSAKRADSVNGSFYLTGGQLKTLMDSYDDEGTSIGNRIGSSPMASSFHAAIWDKSTYCGEMCFESRRKDYDWTRELQHMFRELTRVVASFILKEKADAVSQAKTDFLSRMSHEIRTPMNAISGMTAIAKSMLDDKERTMDCLNKIESSNRYLLELINDVLDMSRIESGKMELNVESVDMDSFMEGLRTLILPQAEAKGQKLFFCNGCVQRRPVAVDKLRLSQVLINIMGNAVKFTNPGGEIRVRIEKQKESDKCIWLRFSVADTGIGIGKARINRIFHAFEQADQRIASEYGGTGLGLSISSRLVQMMGGTLEVESELGKGSEFYFTLSLPWALKAPEVHEEEPKQQHRDWKSEHMRVLLAEDNELNREIAQTLLQMNGFLVETAADGAKALKCYQSREPGYYQVILMDIRMPVMDGLETTKQIRISGREDARTIPIIALTANAFDEDLKKSMESGMNGHLAKPIEMERLLQLLEQVC